MTRANDGESRKKLAADATIADEGYGADQSCDGTIEPGGQPSSRSSEIG
jgi:hypothetical protein